MQRIGFTVSLVLALFSLSLLGINEVERVNQAKKQAQEAIESMDDGRMAVHPLLVLDIVIDTVSVCIENHTPVAVFCDVFVNVLEVLADQKSNSSVIPTDEWQ
ncbi:MAG: hypothetical protein BRC25_03200, partial [Parcubacteria group bacterium SW_6_46_9]